jgi:hypothetical protein
LIKKTIVGYADDMIGAHKIRTEQIQNHKGHFSDLNVQVLVLKGNRYVRISK